MSDLMAVHVHPVCNPLDLLFGFRVVVGTAERHSMATALDRLSVCPTPNRPGLAKICDRQGDKV
jgi:hypothetical protein